MPALANILPFKTRFQPREKCLKKGVAALSDVELLAAMLGSGTKRYPVMQLAQKISAHLKNSDQIDPQDLTQISGIGQAKAVQLVASLEFARRRFFKTRPVIQSCQDLVRELNSFAQRQQEYFLCVSLNGARELLATRIICVGNLNRVHVKPCDVFTEAISDHATYVYLAHNHPCGQLRPSLQDRQTTRLIRIAGRVLGIDVLDHLILSPRGYHAMSQDAYWNQMVNFD
jgi:DNA repair protein RadC